MEAARTPAHDARATPLEVAELLRRAGRLAHVVEATTDLVAVVDPQGGLLLLNRAARRTFGVDLDVDVAELDRAGTTLRHPQWAKHVVKAEALPAALDGEVWQGEVAYLDGEGTEVPVSLVLLAHRDDEGELEFFAAVARDISDRKQLEARLEHQAHHDPLTSLPNRALLLDRLGVAMHRAERKGHPIAVIFCDLDNFKVVNDSLGHDVGDALLQAVSARIQAVVRPSDTVARFGGDEFVVLCDDLSSEEDALHIAQRLAAVVGDPVTIGSADVVVAVSMGIAFRRHGHRRPEDLLRDADAAMYRAKDRGRDRYEVFDDEMRERVLTRLDVERGLRRAVERRELRLHYQPVCSVADGTLRGFEALLRWEHPERGLLLPGDFLKVAEETGLIVPIGRWILQQAARQLARWQASYPAAAQLHLAINISARQVAASDLVADVDALLAETGIDPRLLDLEMTEHALMGDAPAAVELLHALKRLGLNVAVDDFGTGYSSLAYLRRFPVDILKIDKAFVAGLGVDPEDAEIVRLVITLAHALGLRAIAEGVETGVQLEELRALGCDEAQGHLLSRPLTAAAAEAWLEAAGSTLDELPDVDLEPHDVDLRTDDPERAPAARSPR